MARAAIAYEQQQKGRSLLVLTSGAQAPVCRNFRERAEDAGLTG